MTNNLIVTI